MFWEWTRPVPGTIIALSRDSWLQRFQRAMQVNHEDDVVDDQPCCATKDPYWYRLRCCEVSILYEHMCFIIAKYYTERIVCSRHSFAWADSFCLWSKTYGDCSDGLFLFWWRWGIVWMQTISSQIQYTMDKNISFLVWKKLGTKDRIFIHCIDHFCRIGLMIKAWLL